MTFTLDNITFDNPMIRVDGKTGAQSRMEVSEAMNGQEIVMVGARGGQYPITLEATDKTGWQSGTTVDALRAKALLIGQYWTLTIGSNSYIVRFRDEQSGGAIQMTMHPRLVTTDPGATTWYIGKIYFMCVG